MASMHNAISKSIKGSGLATHVGAEPAGPELSGKNSHVLTAQRSLRAGRMTGEYYVKA